MAIRDDPAEDVARAARAEARRSRMVIVKARLGDEVDACPVSGADGVALVARLSAMAWTISGRPLPGPRERPVEVVFTRRPS